jgi:NADH-quinone oxidoreductase subunit E
MITRKSDLLSVHVRAEINRWLERYPPDQKRSVVLTALREVQHENGGYLTTDLINAIADYLEMPAIAIFEVASFYSMFELQPVGRHNIAVCTNISCMLRGSDNILKHIEEKLGIRSGTSTLDGKFYLKREEECLAACCGAPMMQVDHIYYENLTLERVDQVLDSLE